MDNDCFLILSFFFFLYKSLYTSVSLPIAEVVCWPCSHPGTSFCFLFSCFLINDDNSIRQSVSYEPSAILTTYFHAICVHIAYGSTNPPCSPCVSLDKTHDRKRFWEPGCLKLINASFGGFCCRQLPSCECCRAVVCDFSWAQGTRLSTSASYSSLCCLLLTTHWPAAHVRTHTHTQAFSLTDMKTPEHKVTHSLRKTHSLTHKISLTPLASHSHTPIHKHDVSILTW